MGASRMSLRGGKTKAVLSYNRAWQHDCINNTIWPFLFCFVPKTVYGPKFFDLFANFFEFFALAEIFSTAQIFFKILLTALRFVWSKIRQNRSHPHRFSAVWNFEKVCPVQAPSKFSMRIQNRNGHVLPDLNTESCYHWSGHAQFCVAQMGKRAEVWALELLQFQMTVCFVSFFHRIWQGRLYPQGSDRLTSR